MAIGHCAGSCTLIAGPPRRLFEGSWRKRERLARHGHAVGAELLSPSDGGCAFEQVAGDLHRAAVLGRLEERALHPGVEGTHRWAAPDLVVHRSIALAGDRPLAGQAEVPAEHQSHAVFGICGCFLELPWISLREEGLAAPPNLFEIGFEHLFLQPLPHIGGEVFDASVGLVGLIETLGANAKHGSAFEDLDLDTELEHVCGGRHDHVSEPRLAEQLLTLGRQSALKGGLVHRAGEHERSAKLERSGNRARGAEAPGGANANGPGVAVGADHLVAHVEDGGEQRGEGLVVRVAAAVRLDDDVFGDGQLLGELGLLRREVSVGHKLLQKVSGGWCEEARRSLGAANLGKHEVVTIDAAIRAPLEARVGVAHHHGIQPHVGAGADPADPPLEVELHGAHLHLGLVGRMDEVAAPGQPLVSGERGFKPVEPFRDPGNGEPRRTKEAEHAGAGHGDDEVCGGDPVGHRPGDVGKSQSVYLEEGPVPQPLRVKRGERGYKRPRGCSVDFIGAEEVPATGHAKAALLRFAHHKGGVPEVARCHGEFFGGESRSVAGALPGQAGPGVHVSPMWHALAGHPYMTWSHRMCHGRVSRLSGRDPENRHLRRVVAHLRLAKGISDRRVTPLAEGALGSVCGKGKGALQGEDVMTMLMLAWFACVGDSPVPTGDTGEPTATDSETTGPFSEFPMADLTMPDVVQLTSQASAANLFLIGSSLLFILETDDDTCPTIVEDVVNNVTTVTGGCTDTSGRTYAGTATFELDKYAGTQPVGLRVDYDAFVVETEEPCDAGGTLVDSLTLDGTWVEDLSTGGFDLDLVMDGFVLDTEACTATAQSLLAVYGGNSNQRQVPNGPWSFAGSGRVGSSLFGQVEAETVDEIVDSSVCSSEAASGTTTLTSGGNTAVITYDGATDCDPESTVTWSLNGTDQGELEGVACATGSTAPLGGLLLLTGALAFARRRRATN